MKPALIVPAERVAVGSEPLVYPGSYEKEKLPCRSPLLGSQVERRSSVNFRDDGAAAGNYVGRVTRVSARGVDAEFVLEVQVRLAQPVVIAKDAAFGHRRPIYSPTEDEFIAAWEKIRDYLNTFPAHIETALHQSLQDAQFRFVNIAHWTPEDEFNTAVSSQGFREAATDLRWPSHPALYQVVRTG